MVNGMNDKDKIMNNCLANANDFFEIACMIDNLRVEFSYKYLSVFVTNLSFSCELYMKYILLKKSVDAKCLRKHNLLELYKTIQDKYSDIAKKIEDMYMEEEPIHDVLFLLESDGNNFIDFRYLYEKKDDKKSNSKDNGKKSNSKDNDKKSNSKDNCKKSHSTDLACLARSLKRICIDEL